MSGGTPMSDNPKPADRALDLFFYAPVGLVLGAEELLPDIVAKGRQQVGAARLFGQFAVRQGQAEASRFADQLRRHATSTVEGAIAALGDLVTGGRAGHGGDVGSARGTPPPVVDQEPLHHDAASPGGVATDHAPDAPSAPSLAIPDYESLAASQVLPRLAGLAADELEAVRAYEAAHRGRKTILNRITQLQSN